ncbi:hypothetical protein RHMOL_Rhmol01G0194800 [Rhododendron molle]|uniref:Uncharacterized protein n=1 Tax=Rhododendron molle TaxID=49168 RepID=A0ACC0Q4N0_RHOML|nr:hypothetical protein RHMOL_Rhmol01G0194800 [Rhododendron molle]
MLIGIIVLNSGIGRGIGVSVSGRIGDTSRESGVAVVNFLKSLATHCNVSIGRYAETYREPAEIGSVSAEIGSVSADTPRRIGNRRDRVRFFFPTLYRPVSVSVTQNTGTYRPIRYVPADIQKYGWN